MISFDQVEELVQFTNTTQQVDTTLLSMPSGQEYSNGGNCGRAKAIIAEDGKTMKVVHREIERQRRQEMSALYGSLRSQLPLEYLKGKRTIADHMSEAVKYIKYLENNIKGLKDRRDELSKRCKDSQNLRTSSPTTSGEEDTVIVSSCGIGVDVSINTAPEGVLSLRRVLQLLIDEGLNVVNCSSVNVNRRLLHSIQCEITDAVRTNVTELQMKIKNLRQP